jgi:hypothetical protein
MDYYQPICHTSITHAYYFKVAKICSNQLRNEQNMGFASEGVNVQFRHIRANFCFGP